MVAPEGQPPARRDLGAGGECTGGGEHDERARVVPVVFGDELGRAVSEDVLQVRSAVAVFADAVPESQQWRCAGPVVARWQVFEVSGALLAPPIGFAVCRDDGGPALALPAFEPLPNRSEPSEPLEPALPPWTAPATPLSPDAPAELVAPPLPERARRGRATDADRASLSRSASARCAGHRCSSTADCTRGSRSVAPGTAALQRHLRLLDQRRCNLLSGQRPREVTTPRAGRSSAKYRVHGSNRQRETRCLVRRRTDVAVHWRSSPDPILSAGSAPNVSSAASSSSSSVGKRCKLR